jgi:amidase
VIQESALFLVTLGPRLPGACITCLRRHYLFSALFAGFVRGFACWVIRNFVGDTKFASLLSQSHKTSVRQYYNLVADKVAFEKRTRVSLWGEGPDFTFDAVLAPVQAIPALPHGGCDRLAPLACATLIYNIVDSPVGIIPVTRVDPARDEVSDEWRAAPGNGSKIIEGEIYGPKGAYKPSAMNGLPVGVQVVGQPWGEEKVLAIMHVVDAVLGPRGFGPGSWAPNKQTGSAEASEKDE